MQQQSQKSTGFDIDIDININSEEAIAEIGNVKIALKDLMEQYNMTRNGLAASVNNREENNNPGVLTDAATAVTVLVNGFTKKGQGFLKFLLFEILGEAISRTADAILGGSNKTVADVLEEERKKFTKLQEDLDTVINRRNRLQELADERGIANSPQVGAVLKRYDQTIERLQTEIPQQKDIIAALEEKFARTVEGRLQALDQSFYKYKLTALPLLSKIDRSTFYLYNRLRQYDPGEGGSDPQSPSIFDQSNDHPAAHTGGIIGEGGGGRLGSLYGVPRYHSGGLIGAREQLAILQRGEGVFTPGQMQNADRLIAALARPLIQLENELIDALSGRHLLRDRQTQLGSEAQMIEIHLVHQIAQDLLSNAMLNSGERRIQRSQFDNIVQAYEGAGTDLPFADYAQSYRNFWDQVEASGLGALQEMENSLIQFVETGKFEFSDLTNSILRDLLRISARETITKPLANALGSVAMLFTTSNMRCMA